jgi:hypothetical protein
MNELPPMILIIKTRAGTQTYALIDTEPYTNRHGKPTRLAVWRTACRSCGSEFLCRSGASSRALKRGPGYVRCPDCRPS